MNLLSLFSFVVIAQELIISPLPSSGEVVQPRVSFKMITQTPDVLGSVSTNSGLVVLSDAQQPLIPPTDTSIIGFPTPTPTAQPTAMVTPTPISTTPTPTSSRPQPTINYPTRSLKVAFLGDSMIDTLGPTFYAFSDLVAQKYPHITLTVLNYGVGATNLDYGITRITNEYQYLGKNIPALASQNPDIVVLESFAYNPFSDPDGGLNHHWLSLAKAVETLRTNLPRTKIVIAATIAPSKERFGDGAPMISFSSEEKQKRTAQIRSYLESTIQYAQGQHLPVIDAYHPSLTAGSDGTLSLINSGDHIHYSDEGRRFFAQKTLQSFESIGILP